MGCFQLVDADRVGSVRLTESLNEPVEVSVVVCDLSKFADCFLSPRRLRETLTLLGCSHTHAQHHDAPVGAFVDLGGHETWLLEDYLPDSVGDPSNQLVLPRWVDRPGIDQDWGFHCTIHSFQGESDEASGSRGAKATGCSKICAPSSGCCLTSATSPAHRLGNIGDTILERFRGANPDDWDGRRPGEGRRVVPVSSSRRRTCPLPGITRKSYPCSAHSSWASEHRPQTGRVHERQSAQVELDGTDTLAAQAEDHRFQPRGHREVQLAAQQERMTAVAHALLNFKGGLTRLQGHASVRQVVLR